MEGSVPISGLSNLLRLHRVPAWFNAAPKTGGKGNGRYGFGPFAEEMIVAGLAGALFAALVLLLRTRVAPDVTSLVPSQFCPGAF
jgi:hypothetical protein